MILREAAVLARMLMEKHGIGHWRFDFDRSVRRMGCCDYDRQVISLSYKLVERAEFRAVVNTILHEIAHALVGPGQHHNEVWRTAARSIGCNGNTCYDSALVPAVPGTYQATCPSCWKIFHKHRMVQQRPGQYRFCKKCGPIKGRLNYARA